MERTRGQPCNHCKIGDHTFCPANWGSVYCTCQDAVCLRSKYNRAVRNVINQAERLGLMVLPDLSRSGDFPTIYTDVLVTMVIPTGDMT